MPNSKIGFSKAMSAGWLRIEKNADAGPHVFRKVCEIFKDISFSSHLVSFLSPPSQVESIIDTVQQLLSTVEEGGSLSQDNLKEFKKRQLVTNVYVTSH